MPKAVHLQSWIHFSVAYGLSRLFEREKDSPVQYFSQWMCMVAREETSVADDGGLDSNAVGIPGVQESTTGAPRQSLAIMDRGCSRRATGTVGSAVLNKLVEAGFQVSALTRTTGKVLLRPNVTEVVVDFDGPLDLLTEALKGHDAVVSATASSRSYLTIPSPSPSAQHLRFVHFHYSQNAATANLKDGGDFILAAEPSSATDENDTAHQPANRRPLACRPCYLSRLWHPQHPHSPPHHLAYQKRPTRSAGAAAEIDITCIHYYLNRIDDLHPVEQPSRLSVRPDPLADAIVAEFGPAAHTRVAVPGLPSDAGVEDRASVPAADLSFEAFTPEFLAKRLGAEELPTWNAFLIFSVLHGSLTGAFGMPRVDSVLMYTGYLTSLSKSTARRLMETSEMILNAFVPGELLKIGGAGWMNVVKVRLMHADNNRGVVSETLQWR
ncbi:hypothetical protein HK405_004766 [Cladochytrium tenue]|nr:hypothetical protein HK405_004766 [Cladochytrium tenue]